MKTKFIKIDSIKDITDLVKAASAVDGDVEIRKGRWVIDGSSLMGVMSIDLSGGATIAYPEDAIEFENFLNSLTD